MLRLLIARHGNTFDSGDTVTRVGARTNLPLSLSGKAQAKKLSSYLFERYPELSAVYCSELARTRETAKIVTSKHQLANEPQVLPALNEIDYGVDENQPEAKVIARVGLEALARWDQQALPPPGWLVDVPSIKQQLLAMVERLIKRHCDTTILLVTSNGVARFLPEVLGLDDNFSKNNALKLPTASLCECQFEVQWQCLYWGKRV